MNKNKWLILISLIVAFICISGWAYLQRSINTNIPKEVGIDRSGFNKYKFDSFTLNIPKEKLVDMSGRPDLPPVFDHVVKSDVNDESGCVKVSGVENMILHKQTNSVNRDYPVIDIQAWNEANLSFVDEESLNTATLRMQKLSNLADVTAKSLAKYGPRGDTNQFVDTTLLNPWEGYLYCSGIYTYPIYLEKINSENTQIFDSVYYGEVVEGNGDMYSLPLKLVIAKRDHKYLIYKEQQDENSALNSVCTSASLQQNSFECVKEKAKYLRKTDDYKNWVNEILSYINITI